ncbi:YDG/SRA domain-containing protein [Kitasatospora sp. NPDC101157]|uniref:YDG/SRA domain-containing protein n=1 Tax=Kitasatospora sp. NPDC101157 TaxID=3364098 RepID=UPI0037FE500E
MSNDFTSLASNGFDGFGAVPGVVVGQAFANRRALADARVHRPLQAGICGIRERGAESVLVSGGYEDDRDHGDEIVFTGQGGRGPDTDRQVEHQRFERGNAALVTSMTTGRPVRVVRAEGGGRRPAYRYGGLFRVEECWFERGRSGFLVCRYRLVLPG